MRKIFGGHRGSQNSTCTAKRRTAVAELCGQLGYPTLPKQMASRPKQVLREKSGACFLAETAHDGVVGWGHVRVTPLIEVERRAEVSGLLVDEKVPALEPAPTC